MNNKGKRFYTKGEVIWVIDEKKEGTVESINRESLEVEVSVDGKRRILKLWEIDKLKFSPKEQLLKRNREAKNVVPVYFAKVRDSAIIPSKRDEDAGFDLYANLEGVKAEGNIVHELYLPAHKTTLVPTGIAIALPKTHYFNCKHERGSTGRLGMSVLSGVVDSGYRGEIFVAINPLHKDILITSEADEVEELDHVILYPYSKAIAQATIDLVPQVEIKEIPFEELKKIESERKDTKLGQSGK